MDYAKIIKNLTDSYGDWWKKGYDTPRMAKELYPYQEMFSPIKNKFHNRKK